MNKLKITFYTTADPATIDSMLRVMLDDACIEYGNLETVANQHPLALSVEAGSYNVGIKGIAKTAENSCQVRYLGGAWVITDLAGDVVRHDIQEMIKFINEGLLYITNETIFTEEYAKQLWYKRTV